jgi:hypothetical protein
MLQHVKFVCESRNTKISNPGVKCMLHNTDFHISKKDEDELLIKYFEITSEIFSVDLRGISKSKYSNKNLKHSHSGSQSDSLVSSFENLLKSIVEILKDDSLIYLLDNINILTFEEANLIYKILKSMIIISLNDFSQSLEIKNYFEAHYENLVEIIFSSFIPSNKDYIIIIMGKTVRKLIQIDSVLQKILNKNFFIFIYTQAKCDKFVLPQECFKILFHLVESEKSNKKIVANFLSENAKYIFSVINSGLNISGYTKQNKENECLVDEFYYMKRESLIFIEKILIDADYETFTNLYVNSTENLKMVMMQLNNKCEKIVCQAIDILYFFFLDIETKHKSIKMILHTNKQNFYNFFEKNEELILESSEMMEKKNFILYELERLENYLD